MRLSFHYEPEFHIDLRPVASMTAIGAKLPLTTYIADRDGSTETESHPRRSDRTLRDALDE